jgi:hypothetical protein
VRDPLCRRRTQSALLTPPVTPVITAASIDGRRDRFGNTLGGRLHQAIYFDDGDITAIA